MVNSTTGNKVDLASPSKVRFAKDNDPIYSRGWTITTRVWGKPPTPESKSSNQDRQKISEDAP